MLRELDGEGVRLAVQDEGEGPPVLLTVEQREKSWYMLMFQFARAAEELLQRDDWRLRASGCATTATSSSTSPTSPAPGRSPRG